MCKCKKNGLLITLLTAASVFSYSAQATVSLSAFVSCNAGGVIEESSTDMIGTRICQQGTASAEANVIGFDAVPLVGGTSFAENLGGGDAAVARTSAQFTDLITITSSSLAASTVINLDMYFLMSGSVTAVESLGTIDDATADPFGIDIASASGSMSVGFSGTPTERIDLNITGGPTIGGESYNQLYNANAQVRIGQTYRLDLVVLTRAAADYSDPGALGPARAFADFGNTLAWAGFGDASLLDGNLLDIESDLIFSSTSGYNYLNSAVVPVPAAFWLFASGLLGLIGIAKRKQN